MINFDKINQMPSGTCVHPFSISQRRPRTDRIVVCKEKKRIKIFKVMPEESNEEKASELNLSQLKPGETTIVTMDKFLGSGKTLFRASRTLDGKNICIELIPGR
jgi:hypothetical protein